MKVHFHIVFIRLILFIFLIPSCVRVENSFSKLPPGIWRATLQLEGSKISDPIEKDSEIRTLSFNESTGELPFNFEVTYDTDTSFHIDILNGEEKIRINDIQYIRDSETAKDTVIISFKEFDSYIEAIFVENRMEGFWYVNYRESYKIPFSAVFGQRQRFNTYGVQPTLDISGSWEAYFDINEDNPFPAKAVFEQSEGNLAGTFLTETGDYRYLSGSVIKDKIFLSCFDGAHAFLFEAKMQADSSLYGIFRSGTHYMTEWSAKRNEGYELPDAFGLTYVNPEMDMELNDILKTLAPDDQEGIPSNFINSKVKLVQFMGTWCPNCKDEVHFLQNYTANNPELKLGILGICFERYKDQQSARDRIKKYITSMHVNYPLFYGGYYDKKEVSAKYPMLNGISAYPTLFIFDKDNKLRKIHTGFSGPATDEFPKFSEEFDTLIRSLLNE